MSSGAISWKESLKSQRSNKSPALKAAVVAKRVQGKNKSQIAQELDIGRNTVTAILEQSEIEHKLSSGESLCADLIPEGVSALKANLKSNSLDAAKFILQPVWNSERLQQSQSKRMQSDPLLQQALNVLVRPQVNVTVQNIKADGPEK